MPLHDRVGLEQLTAQDPGEEPIRHGRRYPLPVDEKYDVGNR